jgi:hypothetical protein
MTRLDECSFLSRRLPHEIILTEKNADVYFPGEMVDGLKIVPVSTIGACAQLLKQGLANR